MIVDTHVHIWDLKQLSLPWLKISPTFEIFNRSIGPDDYREDVAELPLEKAIFIDRRKKNGIMIEPVWIRHSNH